MFLQLLTATIFLASFAFANTSVNIGGGHVDFIAVGNPSALKIHGKGGAPRGTINENGGKITGTIQFDLRTLDSGIKLRTTHMKDKYLEVSKFPTSQLEITNITVPTKGDFDKKSVPFSGKLQLHGVTKPIQGRADIKRTGNNIEGIARFNLKLTDFQIAIPSFSDITIADNVDVEAAFTGKVR